MAFDLIYHFTSSLPSYATILMSEHPEINKKNYNFSCKINFFFEKAKLP